MKTINHELLKYSKSGKVKGILNCLDRGADINCTGKYGNTSLLNASWGCHFNAVECLLKNNANPNLTADDNASPLFAAVAKNQHEIVKLLLEYGADPNISRSSEFQKKLDSKGSAPIHSAIHNKNEDISILLLESGAHTNHFQHGIDVYQAAEKAGLDTLLKYLKINRYRLT